MRLTLNPFEGLAMLRTLGILRKSSLILNIYSNDQIVNQLENKNDTSPLGWGQIHVIHKDWENNLEPLGEAVLVHKQKDGLTFIPGFEAGGKRNSERTHQTKVYKYEV